MRRLALLAFLVAFAGLAPACSLFSDDEEAAAVAEAPEVPVRSNPLPVSSVGRVEIGRTRNGVAVSAFGLAPGTGFARPELRARRNGQPGPDGVLDLDFVAQPPDPALNMPEGDARAQAIRADIQLGGDRLRGVRGVRVHTLTNIVESGF